VIARDAYPGADALLERARAGDAGGPQPSR
jgi:hypothetical protein